LRPAPQPSEDLEILPTRLRQRLDATIRALDRAASCRSPLERLSRDLGEPPRAETVGGLRSTDRRAEVDVG